MKASTKVVAIASVLVVLFLALASPSQTVGAADPLSPVSSGPHPDDRAKTDAGCDSIRVSGLAALDP